MLRVIAFRGGLRTPKNWKFEGEEVWTKKGNPKKLRLGGNGLGSMKNGFAWLCLDRKIQSAQFGRVLGAKKPEENINPNKSGFFW